MTAGIVLYGPPASGKDTITSALAGLGGFAMVPRVKSGSGRTAGYRMVNPADIAELERIPGEVLWKIERYAATYVLTRSDVCRVAASAVPVVHVGQTGATVEIPAGVPELDWAVVELWCPREVTAARIAARGTGDDRERLAVYDDTPRLDTADLVIDTNTVAAVDAAHLIHREVLR